MDTSLDQLYLRLYGDPVLRERTKEVEAFGEPLKDLIQRMYEVMYEEEGVGIAAPQVGSRQRLLVLDVPLEDGGEFRGVLVNPEILEEEGKQKGEEGCLSFPGIREEVTRADRIKVRAKNEAGEDMEFQADGFLSRAVQHELDHLNGVLFIDRMSPIRRRLLAKKLRQIQQERTATPQ
ncbi:MAG: peptide deformylase [Candidatus Eisenbacteria bacterium]|uniref:Peptide deformylase n=1 Tax=Eiseniibacteriota bacterium TaxID=2212470 RepID=A0A7Y2E639_UNCEI|nr:peptide deformylase [Candidatus Eisenbacteria bacterium]